jgi:5-methylcytosine-specific restriction enzyme subunit McrC
VGELDEPVVERLVTAGVVVATPLGAGRWELWAGRKVGVVRIGSVTVWVRPKITIARLLWLLGWARREVFEAPGPVSLHEMDDLVPALAEAFCAQAERALQKGLLQGYREVEASEAVLRGRLRTGDQLRQRFGFAVPLLIGYDDFLVDIAENQILKAATSRLLLLDGIGEAVRARLRRIRGLLADVSDVAPGALLPTWHPNRITTRYHDALWLAELVVSGGSVDQEPGRLRLDGFLVDIHQVFENFVVETLGAALERRSGHCQAQDRYTLDDQATIGIRPDLVWRIGGRPVAVIDAKYKAEKPAGFPQADVYQALAYATVYRLDDAHLVYAHGNEVAREWTVRHAGVRIVAHTLDLDQAPAAILGQIEALAGRIIRAAGLESPERVSAEMAPVVSERQ